MTVVAQVAKAAVQIIATVVLARMLSPADFGLVAMAAVVVALGDLVRDFGMSSAALRAPSLTNQQASNMFWINTALGCAAAVIIAASAPLMVWLYSEPRLWAVVPAMALAVAINGLQVQIQVQLARSFRFGVLGVTDVVAQVVGLGLAIAIAGGGGGYWALVAQVVTGAVALLILRVCVLRWTPRRPRRGHGTGHIARTGANFGAAQLLTFAASNADTMAIGITQSAADVGAYERAFKLLSAPVQILLGPLTQVVLPVANRARDDGRSIHGVLLRAQFLLGASVIVLFAASAAVAEDFVRILLGPGWDTSASIFGLLAIGGAFSGLSFVSYWVFLVEGQGRQLLRYNLVTKPLAVAAIVLAAPHGVEAVALAYSMALAISWPINVMWLRRSAGLDARAFLTSGALMLTAGGVAFLLGRAAWLGTSSLEWNAWAHMCTGLIVSAVAFVGTLAIVPRFKPELSWVLQHLRRRIAR